MDAIELEKQFVDGQLNTKGGTFWFFNKYHFGKPCDNFYKLASISFSQNENILIIQTSYPKLTIWNPGIITQSSGYSGQFNIIKIKTCDKMLLEFTFKDEYNFSEFIPDGNKILINSNSGHHVTFDTYNFIENNVVEFGE